MIVVVRGRCGLNTPASSAAAFLVVVGCLLPASFLLHADLTATATIDEPDVPARLAATAGVQTEIDAFMEKVLARRETNWIELQDYVLDEKESLDVRGPGGVVLEGFHREFTWYVRDRILVRSSTSTWPRISKARSALTSRRDSDFERSRRFKVDGRTLNRRPLTFGSRPSTGDC